MRGEGCVRQVEWQSGIKFCPSSHNFLLQDLIDSKKSEVWFPGWGNPANPLGFQRGLHGMIE